MNDQEIRECLRALPRQNASPAFTSEVLRRVRQGEVTVTPRWRLAAAFALAASIVAVTPVGIVQHQQRLRTEALRAEQQQLESELAEVKKIAMETEPVVVLENGDGTRVIMDFDSAIQTASLRTYD